MKYNRAVIILICLIVWVVNCIPRRKRSNAKQTHRTTGEPIAVDNLIKNYEREHQKFYKENTTESGYMEWLELGNKNLSIYCRKYLQQIVPSRTTDRAIGYKLRKILQFERENINISSEIIIVHCKVIDHDLCLYMTRAPEPNCVYALKSLGRWTLSQFTIINKHCDFEYMPLINRPLKGGMVDIIFKINYSTGQPIAKDEYLWKYESEHQEMLMKEDEEGRNIYWLYAVLHHNLNSYCYQYLRQSVPKRNHDGIIGCWKTEKLHYQKLNTNVDIDVTTVVCMSTNYVKRKYYMTRAPETNCAYALLRSGHHSNRPMVIIFKQCDFEDLEDQQTTP